MITSRSRRWAAACLAAVVMAGCSSTDPDDVTGDELSDDAPIEIAERSLDAAVFYAGLEYRFGEVTVSDLDAENSADGVVEERRLGVELMIDVDVHNHTSQTQTPGPPVTLRWDEPGSDNIVEVDGQPDLRQVPSGASSSGQVHVTLTPADLEVWDDDSAQIVLGRGQEATSQVPFGAGADLIDRAPVKQTQLEGEAIEVGPVTLTIQEAWVRWNQATGQVDDGEALLEISFGVTNEAEQQACFRRGEGNTFSLVNASGTGFADLGVSERCFSAGSTGTTLTGLLIDDDFTGDYTLSVTEIQILADRFDAEFALTLQAD